MPIKTQATKCKTALNPLSTKESFLVTNTLVVNDETSFLVGSKWLVFDA